MMIKSLARYDSSALFMCESFKNRKARGTAMLSGDSPLAFSQCCINFSVFSVARASF